MPLKLRSICVTIAITAALGLAVASTASARPDNDYPVRYKALMIQYRNKMNSLTSRPLPASLPATPRAEVRARLAAQIDDVATATRTIEQRLAHLNPPERWRGIHNATSRFLHVSADGNHRWATAIRSGKREEAEKAEHAGEAAELAAAKDWKKAADAAGVKVPQLEHLISDLQEQQPH